MKNWNRMMATAALLVCSLGAMAETVDEAKKLQDSALAAIKAKGLEGAAKEFNAGGDWKKGSLYLVICGFDGQMVAHSANEKMIGKNMLEGKDASGKPFVKQSIEAAKGNGGAPIDVRWANPVTKKIEDAMFVSRRIPGHDAFIGSMVFK